VVTSSRPSTFCRKNGSDTIASICAQNEQNEVPIEGQNGWLVLAELLALLVVGLFFIRRQLNMVVPLLPVGQGVSSRPVVTSSRPSTFCRKNGSDTIASICAQNSPSAQYGGAAATGGSAAHSDIQPVDGHLVLLVLIKNRPTTSNASNSASTSQPF
jgi:hypothetical protein